MKTKDKKTTTESTVQLLRQIRDRISLEIADMTFEELKEYLRERKKRFRTMPSR
jgi:hypothetical protein